MGKLVLIGLGVAVLLVAGGVGFLMIWRVPPPTEHVEHVIPDARFPH